MENNITKLQKLSNFCSIGCNPKLISINGICTWLCEHDLNERFVTVEIEDTKSKVFAEVSFVSDSLCEIRFKSEHNIPVSTFCVIVSKAVLNYTQPTEMSIEILKFIKETYEKKYSDVGVTKYVYALDEAIKSLERK